MEWKERVLQLERDHDKDFKKIKTLMKKKKESIRKELRKLRDNMLRDILQLPK